VERTVMQSGDFSGTEPFPPSIQCSSLISGRQIAKLLDSHISEVWRGEPIDADDFFRWLSSSWVASDRLPPAGVPEAISVLAAGGRGVWWYSEGDALLGFIPNRLDGYYRVPRTAVVPGPVSAGLMGAHR